MGGGPVAAVVTPFAGAVGLLNIILLIFFFRGMLLAVCSCCRVVVLVAVSGCWRSRVPF